MIVFSSYVEYNASLCSLVVVGWLVAFYPRSVRLDRVFVAGHDTRVIHVSTRTFTVITVKQSSVR